MNSSLLVLNPRLPFSPTSPQTLNQPSESKATKPIAEFAAERDRFRALHTLAAQPAA